MSSSVAILIWLLQPALGLWSAAMVALVIFGLAHAYEGVKGVIGTGLVGSVLTLVVLAFGSLVSAMAVHALIDVGEGLVAWLVLRSAAAREGGSGVAKVAPVEG